MSWTVCCPVCGADAVRRPFPAQDGGPTCPHEDPYVTDVSTAEMVAACEDLLATVTG